MPDGRRERGIRLTRRQRRFGAASALACLALIGAVGCPPSHFDVLPARAAREAMDRITDNAARIRGPVVGSPALVSFRFRDASGRDRRIVGQQATVIFEAPRCLYFDVKSVAGSIAHIGSSDERFWMWIDLPDQRKLWWGTWEALRAGRARTPAVPPQNLLDALALTPLPQTIHDGLAPILIAQGVERVLLFQRTDAQGWPYVAREVRLDPSPPNLPIEIVDRRRDGAITLRATLSGFQPIRGGDAPPAYAARNFVLSWPTDNAEMRLDLADVRYRTSDVEFCRFPDGWTGDVDALDEPALEAIDSIDPDGAFR